MSVKHKPNKLTIKPALFRKRIRFVAELYKYSRKKKRKIVEASNVINDPKCNKGPKCNNFWP